MQGFTNMGVKNTVTILGYLLAMLSRRILGLHEDVVLQVVVALGQPSPLNPQSLTKVLSHFIKIKITGTPKINIFNIRSTSFKT